MNKIILNLYYDNVTQGMQCIRCKDIFQSDSIEILNNHIVHGGCWDNTYQKHESQKYEIPWMSYDYGMCECECGFSCACTWEQAADHQMIHAKNKLKLGFKL